MNINSFIDHTLLKPTAILPEVDRICAEAIEYNFASVCIPPVYVERAAANVKGSKVKVTTVVGFPFGYTFLETKVEETQRALNYGAHEIDMVMNITALKNGDLEYLKKEVAAILGEVRNNNAILKVIIESGILSEAEIIACCDIYAEKGVDFVKTSTGYAEKGATLEAVQLMRQHLPSAIGIKASGGIKTYEFAKQLVDAGATRLGCSASIAIVKGEPGNEAGGY